MDSSGVILPTALSSTPCERTAPVSYTHLDVYKRQQLFRMNQDLLANSQAVGDLEALTGQQGVTLTALSDRVDSGNVGLTRHDPSGNRVTLAADRGGDAVDVLSLIHI